MIEINWLKIESMGKIGLSGYPGRNRHLDPDSLDKDLDIIKDSAGLLVTLIEDEEFRILHIEDIREKALERGLEWIHAPVEDFSVPDSLFMEKWPSYSAQITDLLKTNINVVIHCWGGFGRTGLVTAMVLTDLGYSPPEAIRMVRKARTGTIETDDQEKFCLSYTGTENI